MFDEFISPNGMELQLQDKGLNDEAIPALVAYLNQHAKIGKVNLQNNDITDKGACLLARVNKLDMLDLRGNKVSNTGRQALASNPHIIHLHFVDNALKKYLSRLMSEPNALKRAFSCNAPVKVSSLETLSLYAVRTGIMENKIKEENIQQVPECFQQKWGSGFK